MGQLLFDGGDASGVFAFDHIGQLLGKLQGFLFYDFFVLYDVDRDVAVDLAQYIQIHHVEIAFDLQNILASHLVASGIFDDGHLTVQLVQLQVFVNIHALSCLNMVKDDSVFQSADI